MQCDMFPEELLSWTTLTGLTSLELSSPYRITLSAVPQVTRRPGRGRRRKCVGKRRMSVRLKM